MRTVQAFVVLDVAVQTLRQESREDRADHQATTEFVHRFLSMAEGAVFVNPRGRPPI
jgi:hypothetical protein